MKSMAYNNIRRNYFNSQLWSTFVYRLCVGEERCECDPIERCKF